MLNLRSLRSFGMISKRELSLGNFRESMEAKE